MPGVLAEPVQWFFRGPPPDDGIESDEEADYFLAQRRYIKHGGRSRLDTFQYVDASANGQADGRLASTCETLNDSDDDAGIASPEATGEPVASSMANAGSSLHSPQFVRGTAEAEDADEDSFLFGHRNIHRHTAVNGRSTESRFFHWSAPAVVKNRMEHAREKTQASKHAACAVADKSKAVIRKTIQSQASRLQQGFEAVKASTSGPSCFPKAQPSAKQQCAKLSARNSLVTTFMENSRSITASARAQTGKIQRDAEQARTKTIDCARERAQVAKDLVRKNILMFETMLGASSADSEKPPGKKFTDVQARFANAKPGGA